METCILKLKHFWEDLCTQAHQIHIDPLERKWIKITLLIVGLLIAITAIDTIRNGLDGEVITIDSPNLQNTQEFNESNLGVRQNTDGTIVIRMVAMQFAFMHQKIVVPAGTLVTFRWASADVTHGALIPLTNHNPMVIPGYVSVVKTTFPKPGDYPILCNEYCGLGHDHMKANIAVVAKKNWECKPEFNCTKGAK
jgi:cytochrome c oxidase subunit II